MLSSIFIVFSSLFSFRYDLFVFLPLVRPQYCAYFLPGPFDNPLDIRFYLSAYRLHFRMRFFYYCSYLLKLTRVELKLAVQPLDNDLPHRLRLIPYDILHLLSVYEMGNKGTGRGAEHEYAEHTDYGLPVFHVIHLPGRLQLLFDRCLPRQTRLSRQCERSQRQISIYLK